MTPMDRGRVMQARIRASPGSGLKASPCRRHQLENAALKKIVLLAAIMAMAATTAAPTAATAQKGMSMSRPSMSMSRPSMPTSTYRAPTIAPRPYVAPVSVAPKPYVAPMRQSVVRPASVTRPVPSFRQTPQPKTSIRQTPQSAKSGSASAITAKRPNVRTDAATARPKRTTFRSNARTYGWTAPTIMPLWWMSTMHQPYSFSSYDEFIRRCLRTPERERSKECVRALLDRGIVG